MVRIAPREFPGYHPDRDNACQRAGNLPALRECLTIVSPPKPHGKHYFCFFQIFFQRRRNRFFLRILFPAFPNDRNFHGFPSKAAFRLSFLFLSLFI
jgi:hypothetical protein